MPRAFLVRRKNVLNAVTDGRLEGEYRAEIRQDTFPFEFTKSAEPDEFESHRQHFLDRSYDLHSMSKINHSHDVITVLSKNRKDVGDYLQYFPHLQNELFINGHWQSKTFSYNINSKIINNSNKKSRNNNDKNGNTNNYANSENKTYYDELNDIKYDVSDNNNGNNNNGNRSIFPVPTTLTRRTKEDFADHPKCEAHRYPTPPTPTPTPPTPTPTPTPTVGTNDRPFVCSICGKCFRLSSTLCRHKIIHTSQRPHKCSVCSKSFNRSSTLKTHMRTHSKTKEFCCSICNKGFHQKGNLRNHVLIHTGEKPYACTYCPKAFNKLSNLKFHMHTHTDQQPYRCRFCKISMARRGELKQHILDHHPVERLKEMQAMGN